MPCTRAAEAQPERRPAVAQKTHATRTVKHCRRRRLLRAWEPRPAVAVCLRALNGDGAFAPGARDAMGERSGSAVRQGRCRDCRGSQGCDRPVSRSAPETRCKALRGADDFQRCTVKAREPPPGASRITHDDDSAVISRLHQSSPPAHDRSCRIGGRRVGALVDLNLARDVR